MNSPHRIICLKASSPVSRSSWTELGDVAMMWEGMSLVVVSEVSKAHSRHCICLFACCLSSGEKHSATVPTPCLSDSSVTIIGCESKPWPVASFYSSCLDHELSSQQQNSNWDCVSAFLTTGTQDSIPWMFGLTFIYIITYRAVFSSFCPRWFYMSSTWLLKLTILIYALF